MFRYSAIYLKKVEDYFIVQPWYFEDCILYSLFNVICKVIIKRNKIYPYIKQAFNCSLNTPEFKEFKVDHIDPGTHASQHLLN